MRRQRLYAPGAMICQYQVGMGNSKLCLGNVQVLEASCFRFRVPVRQSTLHFITQPSSFISPTLPLHISSKLHGGQQQQRSGLTTTHSFAIVIYPAYERLHIYICHSSSRSEGKVNQAELVLHRTFSIGSDIGSDMDMIFPSPFHGVNFVSKVSGLSSNMSYRTWRPCRHLHALPTR